MRQQNFKQFFWFVLMLSASYSLLIPKQLSTELYQKAWEAYRIYNGISLLGTERRGISTLGTKSLLRLLSNIKHKDKEL